MITDGQLDEAIDAFEYGDGYCMHAVHDDVVEALEELREARPKIKEAAKILGLTLQGRAAEFGLRAGIAARLCSCPCCSVVWETLGVEPPKNCSLVELNKARSKAVSS